MLNVVQLNALIDLTLHYLALFHGRNSNAHQKVGFPKAYINVLYCT